MELPSTFPVTCHTDHVGLGSTFVAIQGMNADGVSFIPLAISRGATTIVIGSDVSLPDEIMQEITTKQIVIVRVENTRKALAELSAQALDYPAKKLKIIGITGTKGKTTSAFLLEHLFRSLGYKTALLSTVYNKILNTVFSTQLTTQHPDYLHVFLKECVSSGIDYVVMEVAAQALSLHRVYGIEFDAILFTNFDHEHGEFYATMEEYFHAKCLLLKQRKNNAPVLVNKDNAWCASLLEKNKDYLHFSFCDSKATYFGRTVSSALQGIHGTIHHGDQQFDFSSKLIGAFNSYNILGALSLCHALGISFEFLGQPLEKFYAVPGRMELIAMPNGARACIDYAHNPSSFLSVLRTLKEISEHLIVVCGAGGDRDKTKRPIMGALAAFYADVVIFTSDNPRSENPADIIQEMIAGVENDLVDKVMIELDRETAIKKAYQLSNNKSIIALLGKGPDHYQIIQGQKNYFNETEILKSL